MGNCHKEEWAESHREERWDCQMTPEVRTLLFFPKVPSLPSRRGLETLAKDTILLLWPSCSLLTSLSSLCPFPSPSPSPFLLSSSPNLPLFPLFLFFLLFFPSPHYPSYLPIIVPPQRPKSQAYLCLLSIGRQLSWAQRHWGEQAWKFPQFHGALLSGRVRRQQTQQPTFTCAVSSEPEPSKRGPAGPIWMGRGVENHREGTLAGRGSWSPQAVGRGGDYGSASLYAGQLGT